MTDRLNIPCSKDHEHTPVEGRHTRASENYTWHLAYLINQELVRKAIVVMVSAAAAAAAAAVVAVVGAAVVAAEATAAAILRTSTVRAVVAEAIVEAACFY